MEVVERTKAWRVEVGVLKGRLLSGDDVQMARSSTNNNSDDSGGRDNYENLLIGVIWTDGVIQPLPTIRRVLADTVHALQNAGISARTAYIETHSTGTRAGDPIEAEAIANVVVRGRPPNEYLYMVSIKSNVGHTEAASGIASVIKMVFALEEGLIPLSINLQIPNKKAQLNKKCSDGPQSSSCTIKNLLIRSRSFKA